MTGAAGQVAQPAGMDGVLMSETTLAQLKHQEAIIKHHKQGEGKALKIVRDERLYLATHRNFEQWCQEQCGYGRRYANKLIKSTETLGTKVPKTSVELPDGKYRVLYADPPWKYNNTMPDYFSEQGDHYPLMSVKQIREMDIKGVAADNAVLFLWVTSPILEEAFDVIKAWGFKYKTSFVWDKVKHNMGHYNSVRHEFLLVCTRGSCQPDVKKLFDSVQSIERGKHSEKPEEFREIIDTIYPEGKRIELFARREVDGWDYFGNEITTT